MNKPTSRARRFAAVGFAVLSLAGVFAVGGASAANAQGAIACARNSEGICHGYGSSGGGDPWVANLFYSVDIVGYDHIYARSDGSQVTSAYAVNLSHNLHYRTCFPATRGKSSIAICQE
ncbi:hypothetical protein [Subtercola vilae]|uniref:Uncharacterized protein n=1 Tax=Subtercola vilae TaxID=2056433 RepID=A0A4T2BPE2_9MICO|nr:hypothetical protein [Subtercola vilae]TIH33080.1 hypothetical protein D4765_15160 [Subtercola vilae]